MEDKLSMNDLMQSVVWRYRTAYFTQAVEEGIITEEQMDKLMLLHMVRDRTDRC